MTVKYIIFTAVVFLTVSVSAQVIESQRCEPSLIYPEMFFLESGLCFSYMEANSKYSDKDNLIDYLDSFDDETYQNLYRYLYYLREKEYLPALMTLMFMVNTDSVSGSIDSISAEFDKIITGAIKREKDGKGGITPFQSGTSGQPVTTLQLSDSFFSALSFIASYSDGQNRQESDEMMLNRAFLYTISNIQTGIDWQGDRYLNALFNKFVQMKNGAVLGSFTRMFFYHLRNYGPVPSFRDHIKLREIGAVKAAEIPDNSVNRKKSLDITSFFIRNTASMPQIEYVSDRKKEVLNGTQCGYLAQRGEWIENLSDKDPDEYYFNESVKIAEQCPGVFSFPFEIKEGKIVIYDRSYWITDIAVVVSFIAGGKIGDTDSKRLLESAVVSSLLKSNEAPQKTLAMDILSYTNETGECGELILSMFAGSIPQNGSGEGVDPVTKAAEIISDILF